MRLAIFWKQGLGDETFQWIRGCCCSLLELGVKLTLCEGDGTMPV